MSATQTPTATTVTTATTEAMWTVDDLCIYCRRSRRTVERWLHRGLLPHHRLPSGQIVFVPARIRGLIEGRERW